MISSNQTVRFCVQSVIFGILAAWLFSMQRIHEALVIEVALINWKEPVYPTLVAISPLKGSKMKVKLLSMQLCRTMRASLTH